MARHWSDRVIASVAPGWGLRRAKARIAAAALERLDLGKRHYEAASGGRRTAGWRKSHGDANAVIGPAASSVRAHARDLVRNNPYASSGLDIIGDHAVGVGIVPSSRNAAAMQLWTRWAETTACDADGRNTLYGLQKLVVRTVAESNEVLVRRRFRRPEDGLPIPLQLQVLDPDFLDSSKNVDRTQGGGRIIQGIEYDAIGRRWGYWLFREHPGSQYSAGGIQSDFIPASEILHVYRMTRPGQVRGMSWFAPTLVKFKDFDELEDAVLIKQKIAACLAVFITDVDGSNDRVGLADDHGDALADDVDLLEPGIIKNVPPGRSIETVQPPQVSEYDNYAKTVLRAIATGLGLTYEDLTGDYADMPFSAARMSRLRHWARVDDWRWLMLVPQFCAPVWGWMVEAGAILGELRGEADAEWTAPPMPMIDPVNEGLAYQRNIRAGIMTLFEALRERGYNPDVVLAEHATVKQALEKLGIILDSDASKTTQAGQLQGTAAAATEQPKDEAREHALKLWARR